MSVNFLEWGYQDLGLHTDETPAKLSAKLVNDEKSFPSSHHKGFFDMILASDVIYFAACLKPLADCIAHFVTPETGRCLLVNDLVRYELFADRFETILEEAHLHKLLEKDIPYDGKVLKVQVL